MPNDKFRSSADSVIAPATRCFDISPHDTNKLDEITKAIYVGSDGDIVIRGVEAASDVTFRNCQAGSILDIRAIAVRATGTTAVDLIGLA